MAEFTAIPWCHHTMNFWIGCDEVSPEGCATCYARELDRRYQWGVAKADRQEGVAPHWGPDAPLHKTADSTWAKAFAWDRDAKKHGIIYRVFAMSLGDFFDKRAPVAWRLQAWQLIQATPNLRWMILTKRVPNIRRMLPADWGDGYPNVGLMASAVTNDELMRATKQLLPIPARWHGFSLEPQVERIVLPGYMASFPGNILVITGGDSAQPTSGIEPRPYDVAWARGIIRAGETAPNVFAFVKQIGARPIGVPPQHDVYAGEDMDDWPADLRVRNFPPELLS